MGRNTRKRRMPPATKVTAGAAALALGGGGLVWASFHVSAHEDGGRDRTKSKGAQVATISCPDVGQKLTKVPGKARRGVAKELALRDRWIADAYTRLAETRRARAGDANYVDNAILGPLESKRTATLDRIGIDRAGGTAPRGPGRLARCQGVPAGRPGGNDGSGQDQGGGGQDDGGGRDDGGEQGNGGQARNGPVADDFIDIEDVQPNSRDLPNGPAANGDGGSTGSLTTECGTNENGLRNSDDVIVAPGVSNGAQHQHDCVGDQADTAFADESTSRRVDESTATS